MGTSKKSIKRWLKRLGDLKETLLLYALCHQFLQQLVEGDELYTKVDKNKPPAESEGRTIVLMERASRTKQVPAVALGILEKGFSLVELFKIQRISPAPA